MTSGANDFAEIKTDKRPVPLEEISITYDRYSLKKIEGNAPFLRCAHVINEKQILSLAKKYEVDYEKTDGMNFWEEGDKLEYKIFKKIEEEIKEMIL